MNMTPLYKDNLQKKSEEDNVIYEMNKNRFYRFAADRGITLKQFLYVKKLQKDESEHFNVTIREAWSKLKIKMYQMILFLEEDFSSFRLIINSLDQRNKQIIEDEMVDEFHVDNKETIGI